MRHFTRVVTVVVPILSSIAGPAAAQRSPIDTLHWLSGCWRFASATTTVEEQWMTPRGGTMVGMSRTVASGRHREHEFLRIYAAGDTLVYAANPSGQQGTEFRSTRVSASEVVFENPAHDFPQRIAYRLNAPDMLFATISGDRAGRRQPVVFAYVKAACTVEAGAATQSSTSNSGPTATSARTELQPKYDALTERETAYVGGINTWFGENADASFTHVMWTAGGQSVPLATREVLAGAGERMKNANVGANLKNRKFTTTMEKVLARGDTAEALVFSSYTWVFADTAGRYGARGAELERAGLQRRVDKWVRSGADWRLRQVTIIGEEISVGGRLVNKDGKPVP